MVSFSIGFPQAIWLFMVSCMLLVHIAKHGQPRHDVYNAPLMLIVICLSGGLLYWGGFFGGHP